MCVSQHKYKSIFYSLNTTALIFKINLCVFQTTNTFSVFQILNTIILILDPFCGGFFISARCDTLRQKVPT